MVPKNFTLPFLNKEQESKDAYTFYFDRSSVKDFDFIAGNYIRITLTIPTPDDRGNSRYFSITSSPLDKNHLTVTARIIQSAFKKTLWSLEPGTEVQFFGPVGRFLLDETDTRQHVFLAGGIGITPFHSMLLYAAQKNLTTPMTLFVSFSTVEDMVFHDEFMRIATEHPNIKVVYTITKPEESQKPWAGETGRITKELISKYVSSPTSALYYMAGPVAMVMSMEEMIKGLNIPQEQVKKEQFSGY